MSRPVDNRFLVKAAFAPATQNKYGSAVDKFLDWLLSHGLDSDDPSEFDEFLTDYLHDLYFDGGGKGQAQATIFGLMAFSPQLKGRLHLSLLALRGWEKLQPVLLPSSFGGTLRGSRSEVGFFWPLARWRWSSPCL